MKQTIIDVAKKAIQNAISTELVGYDKPLSRFVNAVMVEHETEFKKLINEGVSTILKAKDFKIALKVALHDKLARILIGKMGGELEKKVNELKQDATTRAKITLAINKVMDDVLAGEQSNG